MSDENDNIRKILLEHNSYTKDLEKDLNNFLIKAFQQSNATIYNLRNKVSILTGKLEQKTGDIPKSGKMSDMSYKGTKLHKLPRHKLIEAVEFMFDRIGKLHEEKVETHEFYEEIMQDSYD